MFIYSNQLSHIEPLNQLADAKRAADEHANTLEEVENARRKLSRDQEDLNSQIDDLKNQIQKLEKSKKRLQGKRHLILAVNMIRIA